MNTNTHPIGQEELMAYLDGELPTDRAAGTLSHLEQCPECQTLAADFRRVSQKLMAWEIESPDARIPAAISAALGERLQKREAAKVSSPRLENSRWVWAGAFVIVCLVVGLGLKVITSNRVAQTQRGTDLATLDRPGAAADSKGLSPGRGQDARNSSVGGQPIGEQQSKSMGSQDRSTLYPSMASIEQYLMPDRNAEIALARSAAPKSISSDAKILVLRRHGYETAIEGKNGFVCVVERSWMSAFDSAEFWNPKMRGPACFNPAAARSILPLTIKRTEMVLAGLSKAQMIDSIKTGFDRKELPPPEPGAMCYMMSRGGYLNDAVGHYVPHLMFYVPLTDKSSWGADLPDSPVSLNPQFQGTPEPITEFVIPVDKWSDGTAAPVM